MVDMEGKNPVKPKGSLAYVFGLVSVMSFFTQNYGIGILFLFLFLYFNPDLGVKPWIFRSLSRVKYFVIGLLPWGILLFFGVIVFVIIFGIFEAIGNWGKYEGMSAEEWADEAGYYKDEYYAQQSCMEEINNLAKDTYSLPSTDEVESYTDLIGYADEVFSKAKLMKSSLEEIQDEASGCL